VASPPLMKILRIIARLNVGGPARHVIWLTKELKDDEFQTVLIAGTVPAGEENMGYFAEQNGVKPVFIEEMSRELSLRDAVSLYKIYRRIGHEKPDIIHTHTAKAGTVGRTAAFLYRWLTWSSLIGRPRKVLIVHTFHGHVFHSYYGKLKTKVFIAIEKILARFATDKIIAISPQQLKEIHHDTGIGRESQFAIVPLGIDLAPFCNSKARRRVTREEIEAAEGELLIGLVGRLTEIKNIPLFLKVAALYSRHFGTDLPKLRFIIVGDGHLRKTLEDEAKHLGIGQNVTFLGNRTDTEVVYAGLDIVALTSFNEGTPMSLIEAMASGRAVISTVVGGVVDLLGEIEESRDGFNVCSRGIGVEPGSAESFINGLNYLMKNEKLREIMGARGRKFVETEYSKDRLVKDIRELYRDLRR